jgi:hypothetical protein
LDYVSPLICSRPQFDAIYSYFDLKNSFELVPHTLLLNILSACGLFGGYVIRFHGYVSSRYSVVRFHSIYLVFFEVLYNITQGTALWLLFFNVLINDLCSSIQHARYFLFSDYVKDFRSVTSTTDYILLHADIDSVCGLCANKMYETQYGRD